MQSSQENRANSIHNPRQLNFGFLGVTSVLFSERAPEDRQGWMVTGLAPRLGPRSPIQSSPDRILRIV